MRKSTIITPLLTGLFLSQSALAATVSQAPIYINNHLAQFSGPAFVENGTTIIPIRDFSENVGASIEWNQAARRVDAYRNNTNVSLTIGNDIMQIKRTDGYVQGVKMPLPPQIVNSVTYVPLRSISEAFGADVVWNAQTNSIYVYMNDIMNSVNTVTNNAVNTIINYENAKQALSDYRINGHTFFSQYDPGYTNQYSGSPYYWTTGRNGYCYVTSYAMLLSDITGSLITPKEIADINLQTAGDPKNCYHECIVSKYSRKLVPALDKSSSYYTGYDADRGLTYIDNSSSQNVINAIKEALDKHPVGVMVRDVTMPHTMVAIGYSGNTVYFHDPAKSTGNLTWENTVLGSRDMTTISAVMAIE